MVSGAHDYVMKNNLPRLVPAIQRELKEAESRKERKRAEEALRNQCELVTTLLDSIPSPIFYKDTSGVYQGCNHAWAEFTGTSKENIIGRTVYDVGPREIAEKHEAADRELFDDPGAQRYEWKVKAADGSEKDVIFNKATFNDSGGSVAGLVGVMTDITERKLTEKALKVSEDKYRSIFENAVEGIFQTTPEGRFKTVNPAMAHMHGFASPEEMISDITHIGEQLYVNPEDRARYMKMQDAKGIVQGFETQQYRKDGSIIWVSINARAVRDPTGKVLYYEGTIEDITSRKLAEDAVRQTMEKLRKSLLGTIKALSMTVEARDPYTSGHQRRVSHLGRAIAQGMALPNDTIDNVRIAGIVHDIGKVSVPAEILSKPGTLTDIEFGLIKVHPQSGYDILKNAELPYPIAEIVLQHHERLDGSGYPQGLKDGQTLLEARILAVADVVEAMASHRPYRPARGIDAALEEIEKNKGILYDEKVGEACLQLFREQGFKFA